MKNNLENVKVVKGFYNKTSAKKEIAFQNRSAKQNGLEIIKIDQVDALHLYYTNLFFKTKIKGIGKPEAGKLVIVIYYKASTTIIPAVEKQPTPIKTPKAIKKAIQMPIKKTTIITISPDALHSKTKIINLYSTNNTIIIRPLHKFTHFPIQGHSQAA